MKTVIILVIVVLALFIGYRACEDRIDETRQEVVDEAKEYIDTPTLRARQSEAKLLLRNMHQKQQEFFGKQGHYTLSVDSLQTFRRSSLTKGDYYTVRIYEASETGFRARAEGDIDGDGKYDIWEIDQTGVLNHIYDDISN